MPSNKALLLIILALPLAIACGDGGGGDEDGTTDAAPDTTDTGGETAPDPVDDSISCTYPEVDCGGVCVDTDEDHENCGACGTVCGASEVCNRGTCASACGDDLTDCDGACVDLRYDTDHCGACNTPCPEGQNCGYEVCTSETCAPGEVYCFGHCTSLTSDINNCGECGVFCDIDLEMCQEGECVDAG